MLQQLCKIGNEPLTLTPDIVEAIFSGRQPKGLRLAERLGNGPLGWAAQRSAWGSARRGLRPERGTVWLMG
jgi:hypothetical protein